MFFHTQTGDGQADHDVQLQGDTNDGEDEEEDEINDVDSPILNILDILQNSAFAEDASADSVR